MSAQDRRAAQALARVPAGVAAPGPVGGADGARLATAPRAVDVRPESAPFTELSARRLGPVRGYFAQHPVAMDLLVILVYLAVVLLGSGAYVGPVNDAYVATALTLGLLGAALLFWRRRRPLLVTAGAAGLLVVSMPTTGGASSSELVLAFAMYAVAASRPLWVTWSGFVASTAAAVVAEFLPQFPPTMGDLDTGIDPGDRAAAVVALGLLLLIALSIGISVRNRRLHVAELVARANALARDRDQQAALARAAERSRIAREMHDVVAHSLSVMIALADGAGVALERSPERARAALEELSATGRTALADMRRVLGVLDAERTGAGAEAEQAPLAPQPGPDLVELVERFRTAGLSVRTVLDEPLPEDANLQLTVYRIVQEALTNTLRHAPGTTGASVSVVRGPDAVEVEVTDQGATLAVPPSPGTGRGLIGMRERASVYGGTVEAGPTPGGGWRVHASIPWSPEAR